MPEPLLDAIDAGDVERLAELLAAGADPNAPFKTRRDLTPLQIAVAEVEAGGPIDAIVLLLRHGADVNGRDEHHISTPLLSAVFCTSIESVRILLAAGADVNVRDEEGDSPLRFCANNGLLEMARLLLQCGAGKTIDEAGGSAGMNALGLAAYGLDVDMVRLLVAHGADPHVQDADRMTVFDHLRHVSLPDPAAGERLREICRLLGAPEPLAPASDTAGQQK